MALADGEKSNNGNKWEDEEELVATALVGEDFFIELKLEPEETHDHQCFLLFRGDQLISSDRYSIQTRGNIVQLTLKKSQKDDTGHYSLVAKTLPKIPFAENGTQEGPRRKIRMSVQEAFNDPAEGEPPIFLRRLTDLAVKVGTRTRFLVEIRSSSNPKVTWHRNDHPVQEGSRFSFVHEGNFHCIDVAPVMVEDQGHWTCMVENIHGRSSCTSCLSVIVPKAYKPPQFVEELQALLSEAGIVSLECKVIGVPTPILRWFKDDQEIKAGNVFALTANADDPTSLGIYTCQATNCLGTAYSSSKVHVVGRGSREGSLKPADTLKPSGPLPVFKKILNNESCKIGDTITLSCQIQVPPWPKIITWYNKEGKVEPDDKYHIIEDGLGTYSIDIKGVEAMDEGEWKCVATSDENMKQFSTCYVAMSIPRNYRVPRFMESLKAVLTEEGLVSFECKVVGFPIPHLRWFKDGQELKPGDVYQLTGTNSLGSYCCIARNCMGEAKSTAELTIEDIQNQLNEEERLQLLSYNQVPKFIKGLRSCEARIQDDFTFTIQVSVAPEPTLSWYRDDEPIIENDKYRITREILGDCHLEVRKLEFIDQAEWKCVAENDFGHSITSCFLKLIIPKHFKKPKFLESLRAILTEEGAVNLECKVIGVPQPFLTWYKDDTELKPGDIHRITSGQDGTCCLGTYTCKATNCMGSVSSSASLLGFEDNVAIRKEESKLPSSPVLHDLARNLSLSTINEERTSQLYDTPQTDHSMTMDDKGEVSFSFDGKEVSVSLYETPDLTEEEAIQIVEMYADQLSEHITEGNIIELPPMRFTKETSTTGNLLMEAVVIDVSPDYFAADEEADDLRTEADFEDVSILDDQIQSILSSYSSPVGREGSADRTPVSSPVPKSRTKKKRSGSDSSNSDKCNKSEKSQPKVTDWSESYHSAKEPSFQAQLSVRSQDSVDAFADALSSDGLAKASSRSLEKGIIRNLDAEENVEELENRIDEIAVASLQSTDLNKEFCETTLMESLEEPVPIKIRRKKKSSTGEIAILSKTSSEESYTMNADENEPKEKVKRRESEEKIVKENIKDTMIIDEKRQENQSVTESHLQEQYIMEEYEIDEEKLSSITSSVFSTAPETSEKLNQKMKLLENLKTLSNPVFMLRETLVDLDNILVNSRTEINEKTLHELLINKIVRPIENICEQMSIIENDAIKSAGKKSLIQEIRILLLDSIGGPTEELLRGIELIKSHKSGAHEDFESDLIVLESLTDPVDEILASLAKIIYGLRSKEERELSVKPKNSIILEKMTRAINRFGITLDTLLQKHLKASGSEEVLCLGDRLQSVYQNLDSYILSLPLNKITGSIENSTDTLLIESLVRPVENLARSLDRFSQFETDAIDVRAICELENSIAELKNKLETLTTALETYEKESEKMGVAEKNLELVNYLKWTMDDSTDKLKKMQKSREVKVPKASDGLKPISTITNEENRLSLEFIQPDENIRDEMKIPQSEEIVEAKSEVIDHKKLQSRRETYISKIASLDSTSPELDESLSLPEMLLDPLIDVQAKLNGALRHYESQMPPDQVSLPLTELSAALTELRECVSSVAHIATTLNIEDILNHIINLKEPLLDLQVALSSSPSPEEYILIEEITKPLDELNKIFLAVVKSSSIPEPAKIILNEISKITDDNLEQLFKIQETFLPDVSKKPTRKKATIKPPEEVEQMSLTLSSIHFAISSALEKDNDYSYDVAEIIKSGSELSNSGPAHKLISSVNILRQSIGDVAVAIASPIIPQNEKLEYNYNIVLEELTKLEEPLLNLQKVLLTEKHNPQERYILNDIATPLRALKESVVKVAKGKSMEIIQLLKDVEKDVSLVAMEALKKALIGKIDTEDLSVSDSTPGEVPKVVIKWLDPVESWLSSSLEDVKEKKEVSSAVNSVVNDLKRKVLKIAIQSSYSEPPSDVALIEELAGLKEPLLKVCEVIMSEHNPNNIRVMENLIQPTKHLLGTILDVSLIYQANSILQPVLEALEQLENQIPLSIQMASYEKDLQKAVASLISEDSEQEKSTSSAEEREKMTSEEKISIEDKIKPKEKMVELETKTIEFEESYSGMQPLNVEQQVSEIGEIICQSNLELEATDINNIELLKQQELQMALAKARIEELDLWILTIINPLVRLASTTLSLDRSIDEEVHSLLCRPLDSLYKQIELVESQINRPAGQSLENDVETIIEGFLSPMKQVEIALKSATDIWHKTPAKETVLKFLQDLVESSSDLQQRLDFLRIKLITEAPEQTIQVQKSEASLVETISAVLVPLEGIKEIINNLLEETDDKKKNDTDDLTLIADHASTEEAKHIEQATARPLEELIEAIVDPAIVDPNVRDISTSPEIEQARQALSSSQEIITEITIEKLAEIIVDNGAEARTSESQEKYLDQFLEQKVATMSTQETLAIAEEQPRVSLLQSSLDVKESMFEEIISDIQEQNIQPQENNSSLLIDQHDLHTLLMPTVSAENQQIMEELDDLISSEIQGEKIILSTEQNLIVVDEKMFKTSTQYTEETQEIIVEEKIQDITTQPSLEQVIVKETENLKEAIEKSVEQVPLTADISNENFFNQIEEIVVNELNRQNALYFKSESLMHNIDSAVQEMMIKCPQICQEHVFEESVRDIVVEELLKVKGLTQTDDVATGDRLTMKEVHIKQFPEFISQIIPDEKIHEIISDKIYEQNIQIINQEDLVQAIKTKVHEMFLFPQTPEEIVSEDNIREIIADEIQRHNQIAQEVSFNSGEEKIENLIIEEFHKHNIEIVEEKENLLETVKMKIQEIILTCPEMQRANIFEDEVRNIIIDELNLLEKNKDLESKAVQSIQTSEDELNKIVTAESAVVQQEFEETVKNIISKEIEKQNIHPTTQEKETFEAKIQNKINSYTKVIEENISEGLLRQIIIEEVQKYSAEINELQELNVAKQIKALVEKIESTDIHHEVSIKKDEIIETEILDDAPVKSEEYVNLIKEEKDESVKIKKEEKVLTYSDVVEGAVEMKTENVSEISEGLQLETPSELRISDTDHLLEPNEIIITDIQTYKQDPDEKIMGTQESRQDEIAEDKIKMLVINEIEKQNAQVIVDDDFVNNVTDKVQQKVINHPKIIEEYLLEEDIHNIVETELEEKKVNIVKTECLDIAKKEEELVKKLISPIEKESIILEETVHDMIIEELEKQHVQPSEHEDILHTIEQRVKNLILMHPEECTAKIEENIQEIITHTLEEQKINTSDVEGLVEAVKQEVQIEMHKIEPEKVRISEQVSHTKIIEMIDKQNIEISKKDEIIEVENKVQELILQHPEEFTDDMVDEKVEEIVAEVIEEQKIQVSEVENLCKAEEQMSETKISEIPPIIEEQKFSETTKREIEPASKKIDKESKQNLIEDNKAVEVLSMQPVKISEEKISKEVPKELLEESQISLTSEKGTEVSDNASNLNKIQEESEESSEKLKQTVKQKEKPDAIDEGKKKIQKTEKPLRRPSEMLAQVPEEIVHDIIIEEINKLNIQPSEEAALLKAVEVKIQGMIARYPKVSNIEIQEENVRQIVADQVQEEKVKISESSETLLQAQRNNKKPKVLGSPATTQIQVPEEIVHELVIEELQKQNIELSQENNLVKAIETKIYDFIAQHSETSQEEILEENVKEIVTEQLEKQKASIREIEKLEKITEHNKTTDVFNVPVTNQEQIPEEKVHDMIIDEFHKQNIEPLTEEILVKAVEAKIHDLIAQRPDICKSNIFEESVKDIITEEWTKQQANITEIQHNLVEANKQSVQVEIPEGQLESQEKIEDLLRKKIVAKKDDKTDDEENDKNIKTTIEETLENKQKPSSPEKDTPKQKSSKGEKSLKQKGDRLKRKSSNDKSQEVEDQTEKLNNQEQVDTECMDKKDNLRSELEIKSEVQIKKTQLDSEMKELTDSESIKIQDTFKEEIKNSVIKTESEDQEQSKNYLKKTDKDNVEDINKKYEEKRISRRTDIRKYSKEDMSIDKKYQDEEITSKKLSTLKNNSDVDSSRSTLKDYSLRDRENRSIPPTIEIDYDDSLSQDLSRRSNASTLSKRHRHLESLEYDDKSHYSSVTSRLPTFTPGPRDRGKKPSFCTKLTDRTAAEDSRIKLTCTILSDADLEVDWLKDGKILPPSSNKHGIHLENGMASLELYGVKPKDSGEYSCVAKNRHGQASTEAKLKVYSGYEPTPSIPTFTRSIKDSYRKEENILVLECRVRAQPSPAITWLKDGQVLEIGDRYQQSDLSDGICRLRIFNPDQYDSGLYTCRAENKTRLSDRTSHLVDFKAPGRSKSTSWRSNSSTYYDVTGTDKDTGRPRFSSYLTDHSVPTGGTIALQVEVKGVPLPEITWMRTDKKGTISVPRARTFADSGIYTLIVPDATELETGTYVCRASNTYGYVDTSANVEVISGGRDGGKPAMFISRPPDKIIIVAVGEDVSVSFRAGGVPKPRVIWMKGLTDITNGPRSYKEGHDDYVRLTLKRICTSDEGTYCILLKNRYGCDRSFFSIQVKQRARSLTPSPEWDTGDTDSILASIHDKEKSYIKQVPGPISSEPIVTDGGRNWLTLTWGKPEQKGFAPVVAYRVDAWQLGGDGGARWVEVAQQLDLNEKIYNKLSVTFFKLGVTPVNTFDAFNLRPGEEYKFRITPRNRYGWGEPLTMTNSVTVTEIVKFPEFIKILPGQLKALQGTILSLECEVSSDTTVQIKWYRDTTEIVNGQDSRFTTYFNGIKCSLMIGSLTESDSGRYICEATNTAGRVSTFARVQVVDDPKIVEADTKLRKMRSSDTMNEERPPEFTMRLRDRRVQATYPVRLTCQVTGYPEPEVTWYKYREELKPQNNILIWNDEAHFHTLEINRSTIDDSGIYMARAKNAYGSVSCRCHLVVDKGIRAYIAPEFLSHLDAVYSVKTGGELRMTTQVEAYPTVGITWHRDGHRLRPNRDVVMTLNHDGTVELDLAHITPRDAGVYCCTATNEVGQAETTTRVVVLEGEKITNVDQSLLDEFLNIPYSKEPVFITKPLSTEAYEGDTVIILCEVIGDPKPEVMWLRDFLRHDYYKDAPHFRRVGAGPQYRLEIPYAKLDFTGTYSIIAKNCHGQAKAVISLQIYARGQGKEDNGMESTIKHGNVQTLPVIKRPLRDLRCCDGDAISLECKVHAIPEPDVRWEKGGKLIPLGEDFTIDFDGDTARLSIQHVYPEDEGEYTCVAYNDLGKAYTSACLIVDVPEGKETAISRRLIKPPRLLSPNSTPISTPRSTPVRSLSPSCISKREIKSTPKISRGHIGKRPKMPTNPKFYAVPHNRVVEEGETVRFQCAIAGHPIPWVIWDKEGISITPTARISLKENDDIRVLEITEVTHEDAGLYRVTLENDMGRTEASARLEVIKGRRNSASRSIGTRSASPRTYSIYGSRSNVSPSSRCDNSLRPPRFSDLREKGASSPTLPRWHYRNEKNLTQTETKSYKITCSSEENKINQKKRSSSIPRNYQRSQECGKSEPKEILASQKKIKKLKDQLGQKIKSTNLKQSSSLSKDINLRPLERKSSLKSIAKNSEMNDKKLETLDIDKLKAPVILTIPADIIALQGAKVMLLSTYSGYPKPTVRWLRKGQDLMLNNKTEIKTNAGLTCLTLKEITSDEGGKYEIQVENQLGKESRFVNVTVEGPPEPPRDLVVIKNLSILGEVTISWRSPVYDGGRAITGYSIEMRKGNEPCWIAIAEAKYSLSHKIHRLDPEETYHFRVRTENIHGLSEPGMESEMVNISNDTQQMKTTLDPSLTSEEEVEESQITSKPTIVTPEPGHKFEERFDVLEELGKGRYGVVRRILDKETGSILAAKFVRTIKAKDKQQVYDEINIMNMLKHPKLLKLVAAFESHKEMIMVTEYISGGELFERVVADDFTLTEKDSILFVRQICQAVEYLHNNKIVHLDLKPENIMCYSRTSHRIKLIDFGLAQTLKPDTPVRVLFGTPEFIPPEIISFEPIGTESDMWSVGVICYVLLTGLSPFMGENDAETFANITRADYDFDDKAFHAISEEAKDFISSLLIKRKELRMSARECLKHSWLAQCAESMSKVALPTDMLKKFIVRRKWQKTGNAIRALGRMAILSANSRKNIASISSTPKEFGPENEKQSLFPFPGNLSAEGIQQVLVKHESVQDLSEVIDKNEEQPTLIDNAINECFEYADAPTIVETLNSCIPEDDIKIENKNSETIFVMSESNSPTSERIDNLSSDFITELKVPSDDFGRTDTDISDITDFSNKNIFTVDVDIKPISKVVKVKEVSTNYVENFCSVTSLQINESQQDVEGNSKKFTENNIVIDKEAAAKIVDVLKKDEKNEKKYSLTKSSFIPLQSNIHVHESVSKPWCQTNIPSLDNEDETSRIRRPTLIHHVVRTGSVSRTAKMFEKEEISLPIQQSISLGSRKGLSDSHTRPRNERIRKAFAFWNK